jgi:hypothetical protein
MALRDSLSNDELERAAIATRAIARQHEEQSRRVSGEMREFFKEQSRRYRELARRFDSWRRAARDV